jgi:hypothetical protein
MHAQPQCGAQHDFVDDRRTRVDEKVTSFRRLDDAEDVTGVHTMYGKDGTLAQKSARTNGVSIATGHVMAMTDQKLHQ